MKIAYTSRGRTRQGTIIRLTGNDKHDTPAPAPVPYSQ